MESRVKALLTRLISGRKPKVFDNRTTDHGLLDHEPATPWNGMLIVIGYPASAKATARQAVIREERVLVTCIRRPDRIAVMESPPSSTPSGPGGRWRFLRDVAVFQLKMLLDNMRDLALMPISLVAALIDLFYKGDREGALFYRVLRWGSHSEEVIDVYSPIKHETRDFKINPNYTVDGVIARLENVLVREYEKGGTAASIKAAMDRAIDQVQRESQKAEGDVRSER